MHGAAAEIASETPAVTLRVFAESLQLSDDVTDIDMVMQAFALNRIKVSATTLRLLGVCFRFSAGCEGVGGSVEARLVVA